MQPQDPYGPPPSYSPAPPQQSYPPQTPNQDDPSRYEFFMNPGKPQRPSLLSSGGSFGLKIGMIVGGAILLMIITAVALSFIPSNLNGPELTALGQTQNGLFATCNDALSNAKSQDTKNFASNCSVSLMTEQADLVAYAGKHGLKLDKKVLDLGVKPESKSALKASIAASTYDETFSTMAQSQLTLYMAKLKATFKTAKSAEQKSLLSSEYTTAQLLDMQLKNTAAGDVN